MAVSSQIVLPTDWFFAQLGFSCLLWALMPAASFCWPQWTQRFTAQLGSLQGPRWPVSPRCGLLTPPCPFSVADSTLLMAASWTYIRPHPNPLVAACLLRAPSFMAVPQCIHLSMAPQICAHPFAAALQAASCYMHTSYTSCYVPGSLFLFSTHTCTTYSFLLTLAYSFPRL
jgi:hypothetical protein